LEKPEKFGRVLAKEEEEEVQRDSEINWKKVVEMQVKVLLL